MFSRFFIERPIFAAVVAIIICLGGLVAMYVLPVQQYPTITPVQITVSATYPGADSKTLADSVASPIEAQINGVDNMLYMSSTSSATGQLTLTVYFSLETNPDIAQVQVQNRVNLALPQLPTAVTQLGVSVQKKSSSIMMLIGVFGKGDRYSSDYVANYANVYVLDALKRVDGAGQAQIMGIPDQAMRIWMNPDRMASLGITTSDIANAIKSQNALFGAGQIGQQPSAGPVELTFPVVTQAPFTDPRQYEQIILRASQDGSAIVRAGRRRARRGRPEAVHRRRAAERHADDVHRGLPAARRERAQGVGGGQEDAGGHEGALPGGHGLRRLARHQRLRQAVDRGSDPHAARGGRAGRARRLPVPAELPHDDHLHGRDHGVADRDVRGHARPRLLDQPHHAVRARARHRHGRRRRDRRRRERRAQHARASSAAEGGHDPVDGRDRELARRRRAGDGLRVHPGGVPARHDRPALQAVRDHDRRLRRRVRLRRADADAGDVRADAEAQSADAARVLRVVQPPGRRGDARLRPRGRARDQAVDRGAGAVRRVHLLHLPPVHGAADELRAERGPGLRDGGDHHAGGREHRPRPGGGREGGRDLREDPRRRDALDDHRLQPARQRLQDQLRRVLRDAQGLQGALRDDRVRARRRTRGPCCSTCCAKCRTSSRPS